MLSRLVSHWDAQLGTDDMRPQLILINSYNEEAGIVVEMMAVKRMASNGATVPLVEVRVVTTTTCGV